MLTIIDASLHGSTLFIAAQDSAGRISRYAVDWATAQSQGQAAVTAAMQTAGATPSQSVPGWVQQLVGVQVSV